jgi:hypothetical protein
MEGNGLLHLGGSIYMTKAMPGVYSAPIILAAAIYLLASVSERAGLNSSPAPAARTVDLLAVDPTADRGGAAGEKNTRASTGPVR